MVRYLIALVACLAAFGLAACGGDDDDGGATGRRRKPWSPPRPRMPRATSPGASAKTPAAPSRPRSKLFNKENPKLNADLLELPESADLQREQQVQRLRAESSECDVLGMDVIWTAEYAAAGWLYDITPVVDQHEDEFIPSTVETVEYEGKKWALPYNTNAGFVYYRTNQVSQPPSTWEQVYEEAQKQDGLVYQGERYEGLTVGFLELLFSAGGSVLSEDGETVEIDSPEAREVLEFMGNGVKDGAVPKAVTTYEEESSRRAFEAGKATFMRNWPYAYALGKESAIADDFDIATFPGFAGNEGAGVVGGYNLGISAYSDNPEGSLAFAEFLVTPAVQKQAMEATLPATVTEVYKDPKVREALPFAPELLKAVEQAEARPVSPVYTQISQAIYDNVFEVLNGRTSPDEAATTMNSQIEEALARF